jgi:hypothetical protein
MLSPRRVGIDPIPQSHQLRERRPLDATEQELVLGEEVRSDRRILRPLGKQLRFPAELLDRAWSSELGPSASRQQRVCLDAQETVSPTHQKGPKCAGAGKWIDHHRSRRNARCLHGRLEDPVRERRWVTRPG